jgi:hypothetical protein
MPAHPEALRAVAAITSLRLLVCMGVTVCSSAGPRTCQRSYARTGFGTLKSLEFCSGPWRNALYWATGAACAARWSPGPRHG